MASSKREKKEYPGRLYPKGKSPLQKRSIQHSCTLSRLCELKDSVGEKVYADICEKSVVGVLLKLADSGYIWCAKTVHHYLTNQFAIERRYEIWSLIKDAPIRFSLYEFSDIYGLNCDPTDEEDKMEIDHRDLWDDMKVDPAVGPNWHELEDALSLYWGWSFENRKKLGMLYVVHVGIMGLARNSRIPLEYAKRVLDEEAFEIFLWGLVSFRCLIDSIKVVCVKNDGYVIRGCVHVLLIWAFESISVLGKAHGDAIEGDNVLLLSWLGGRTRYSIGDFLATQKKKNKLQVQHLSVRP